MELNELDGFDSFLIILSPLPFPSPRLNLAKIFIAEKKKKKKKLKNLRFYLILRFFFTGLF